MRAVEVQLLFSKSVSFLKRISPPKVLFGGLTAYIRQSYASSFIFRVMLLFLRAALFL